MPTENDMGSLGGLELGETDALFLDFDGTLADIGPDPAEIRIPDATYGALQRLSDRLGGAVAMLSGRDLRDLASRTPERLWRAGGHGLEIAAPGAALPPPPPPPPERVLEILRGAAEVAGVRIEIKGPVAAVHFRAAPHAEIQCLRLAERAAAAVPNYLHQAGKMVVEVKPIEAHKGRTLRKLAVLPPFDGRRPIMIGDDTTDEDAIAAAQALGGIGVRVGGGRSEALLDAPDPPAVRAWIEREAARP